MGKWEKKELGEICYFENGDRGKNYPSRSDYVEKGIPFINTGNLSFNEININNLHYISKKHFDRLSNGKVKNGDIIFCLRGSLGKFALVSNIEDGAIASSLVIIRVNKDLDNHFLSYYFQSSITNEMINKYDNGSAQPNLSAANLKKFKIPLPPLKTQKKIVSKLDALFARIDKSIGLLEENIQHTKDLMASVLDGEFSAIDNEIIYKLSNISKIGTGKTPLKNRKDYYEKGTINWTTSGATSNDFIDYPTSLITELAVKENNLKIYPKRTLIVALYGQGKTRGQVSELRINSTINQACVSIQVQEGINHLYVKYFLKMNYLKLRSLAAGGTQPNLNMGIIKNLEFYLPSFAKQNQIVEKLDNISMKSKILITQQTEKLKHLQSLKSSLLDMAFKGELV